MAPGDETHMAAMLRCMQYLTCTKDAGLLLKPTRKWDRTNKFQFKIRGKLDLDYAKDTLTQTSVSGYVIYLEEAPVMHRSAKKKTVPLSSWEAELNTVVLCVWDMLYSKNLLESIGLKLSYPCFLEVDNKGAVDLINSFTIRGHTCHIDVKQCFLQELKESKQLIVNYISGSENNADLFTRNLDGPLIKKYVEQLLVEGVLDKHSK
jgi:hypothetical protein